MEPLNLLGARIRTLRKRRGLTQEELAARIGRSVEALSVLERGRSTPTLPVLSRLAETLQVPLRDFFEAAGAGGGAAQNPKEAALFAELIDRARALPPAALELAVRLLALVADHANEGRCGEAPPGDRAGETLAALLRLYGNDRPAVTAMLSRRRKFLREMGDEAGAAFLDAVLKRLRQR